MTPLLYPLTYSDEDMQSTFSAIEPGQSMMYADEDEDVDEDDLDEAATLGTRLHDNHMTITWPTTSTKNFI